MAAGYSEMLERFRQGPGRIHDALGPAGLSRAGAADGASWSVGDVIVHLADAELVRAVRIRLIIASDSPALFDFDETSWRDSLAYGRRDAALSLRLYAEAVGATADLLEQSSGEIGERSGVHPQDGPLTIAALIERGVRHALDHATQLAGMLRL